jgi:hypothetical protein
MVLSFDGVEQFDGGRSVPVHHAAGGRRTSGRDSLTVPVEQVDLVDIQGDGHGFAGSGSRRGDDRHQEVAQCLPGTVALGVVGRL